MITLMKLNNYRKCKLWVNEINNLPLTRTESIIEKTIPSCMKKTTEIVRIALELSLSKNHNNYALVGFEFKPSNTNEATTKITVFTSNEQLYYSSEILTVTSDKVITGISGEYGQSVVESAIETLNEIGGFPSGEIIFNIGAHAECGSSNTIFAQVTRVLIKLSQLNLLSMTESEIQCKIESMI